MHVARYVCSVVCLNGSIQTLPVPAVSEFYTVLVVKAPERNECARCQPICVVGSGTDSCIEVSRPGD